MTPCWILRLLSDTSTSYLWSDPNSLPSPPTPEWLDLVFEVGRDSLCPFVSYFPGVEWEKIDTTGRGLLSPSFSEYRYVL